MMNVLSLSMDHFSDEFTQSMPSGGGAWLEEGCAFEGYILSQPYSGSLSASTLRTAAFLPQAQKQEPADPGASEAGSQRRILTHLLTVMES